jgi:short-subunit dehydrogenase
VWNLSLYTYRKDEYMKKKIFLHAIIYAVLVADFSFCSSDFTSLNKKVDENSAQEKTSSEIVPKKAIVVGASSGMGRETAKLLAEDGYVVGLAARRIDRLEELSKSIKTTTYVKQIDASKPYEAEKLLEEMISEMGGLDLMVITISGYPDVGLDDANKTWKDRSWSDDAQLIYVDVIGFYALARTTLKFFEKQNSGHLVGFSSVDGIRNNGYHPLYSAVKGFESRYMEGERNRFAQKGIPITVTDIIPGWVNVNKDLNYLEDNKEMKVFWVESLQDAATEIFLAIKNKEKIAYITKRWEQFAETIKTMPDDIYNALGPL